MFSPAGTGVLSKDSALSDIVKDAPPQLPLFEGRFTTAASRHSHSRCVETTPRGRRGVGAPPSLVRPVTSGAFAVSNLR
jgi:hypothetical protein